MIKYNLKDKSFEIEGRRYPDSLWNYRHLAAHSIMTKGPVYRHYDFPGEYRPMCHQVTTVDFMTRYDRGFCFNDIGTGKTLIMYWYFDAMRKLTNTKGKCLVIAPLSSLEYTHEETIKWNFPHLKYQILFGHKSKRLTRLDKKSDIYIINFDGLLARWRYNGERKAWEVSSSDVLEALSKREDIEYIFIDEVAVLRNKETNAWRNINYLYGPHSKVKMWGFTGSPVPKDPTDAYAQSLLVNPLALPQKVDLRNGKRRPISITQFKNDTMYKDPRSEYIWHRKDNWEKVAYKALQPSIRFTRKQVEPDLPDKIVQTRKIALTEVQRRAYNSMLRSYRATFKDGVVTAVNEGARLGKLIQISCGAVYGEERSVHELSCKPRIDELISIKEQLDDHLLVAIPFVNLAEYLTKELRKKYNVEYITKDISMPRRREYFERFNKGNLDILLATPSSIPHSINLQEKCHTTIWWGPINRFDVYEQFCGRNDRKGQTKKVLHIHFASTPTDYKVYAKLKDKENAQGILKELLNYEV